MAKRMLRADQVRAGHRVSVNGKWTEVGSVEKLDDGRLAVRWGAHGLMGVRVKPETPFFVLVPNARFWVYWAGDWVKLTLAPGEQCAFEERHATDEGWSAEYHEYGYDDNDLAVESMVVRDGVDCDGRMVTRWVGMCPVSRLRAVPAERDEYGDRPDRPDWQRLDGGVRDYTAEAAGY